MMNAHLQKERQQATFDPERLTHLLDGGQAQTKRRRYLEQVIARDPTSVFDNSNNSYMHRTDRYVRSLAKHVRLVEIARLLGIGKHYEGEMIRDPDFLLLLQAIGDDLPTSLHWIMFVPNLMSLADNEQQKEWLPLCRDWKMIGCYAQTELGHGSNIRALETTATFVPSEQGGSWRIHSPKITSAKFWPGTLGRTANHAVVIARLIDGGGIDQGIHHFLVPLRSMRDHTPLSGVTTGDVGPKIGYNNMDNGFAIFENVMIPRRNMLMRFASVDKRGRYTKNGNDAAERVSYITMMQVRAYICNEAGKNLAMACCIAIRYSAIRLQGFNEDGTSEVQVLDYKQQQHRLFPLLAASYCFFFTGKILLQRLTEMERRIIESASGIKKGSVSKVVVADIHATSSALKSFTTTLTADGMEDCRKACGGHGFLTSSGFTELITTYLQNPTVEGDNHMLPQQVVKVLLKVLGSVRTGEKDLEVTYSDCDSMCLIHSLQVLVSGEREFCLAASAHDMLDLRGVVLPAFEHRAARLLIEIGAQLRPSAPSGKSFFASWNDALVIMARFSRSYSQLLLLRNFLLGISTERENSNLVLSSKELHVLTDLARLLAMYWMEQDLGGFCEDSYVTPDQASWIHNTVLNLLTIVRPNAVALVDARDFSNFRLKSALGRYDGDAYPAIMEASRRDPLNATNPGPGVDFIKRLIIDNVGVYNGTISRL